MSFSCDKCGLCCKNISKIRELAAFDSGNGTCIYLTNNNLCSIYTSRPKICQVDLMYEKYFKSTMPLEKWYELNSQGCKKLKAKR